MPYPFSSSSQTTAAGKSIPLARGLAQATGWVAGLVQSLWQLLLLDVSEVIDRIVALEQDCRRSGGWRRASVR